MIVGQHGAGCAASTITTETMTSTRAQRVENFENFALCGCFQNGLKFCNYVHFAMPVLQHIAMRLHRKVPSKLLNIRKCSYTVWTTKQKYPNNVVMNLRRNFLSREQNHKSCASRVFCWSSMASTWVTRSLVGSLRWVKDSIDVII